MSERALRHLVNGWLDSFRSPQRHAPTATPSRLVKVESRYLEDEEENLHEAADSVAHATMAALQKQIRAAGFKGAQVSGFSGLDTHGRPRSGFAVHYQGKEYDFSIDETELAAPGKFSPLKGLQNMKPNFSLTESDKKVIKAFVAEKSADSRLLQTDGRKLEKHGLGSEVVARWTGGRISIVSTESVKSDESIIRFIVKTAGPGIVDFSYARKGHRTHGHGAMGRNPALDDFTQAFFETALWSTNDESNDAGGDPLDENYSIDDIDPTSLAGLAAECARFQEENADAISQGPDATVEKVDARAGHDFWLTRNGHGAGFWDGDWPEPQATQLTEASEKYGNVDLYVGDDGVIYASGYEAATQTPNGRGLYHGTGIGKNDFAIYQGRGNRWRLDLVTGASGTHTDVTGPNSGYENPEAAFEQALHEQHRRGTRGKSSVFIQAGDGYKLYEPEGAHLPFEPNGPRTGILSDGTRVNVYHKPGTLDEYTVVPHSEAWDSMEHGDMRSMLATSSTGRGFSQWTEGLEGRHLGRKLAWQEVPDELKRHIESRVVDETMVANASNGRHKAQMGYASAQASGAQADDYIIGVVNRDGEIGLFRVRTGDLFEIELSADLQTIASAAEIDARNRGTQDAVVFEDDGSGSLRQIGHVFHGRWQVEMSSNASGSTVDEHAATELSLYIENEYSLIGAANSIGKSIDANLRRKIASGKYDSSLAPKAWAYLIEAGAKKYSKDYSTGNDWSKIFSAATRRKVAEDFARAWEQENIAAR